MARASTHEPARPQRDGQRLGASHLLSRIRPFASKSRNDLASRPIAHDALVAQNNLLQAAGFAPIWRDRPLESEELEPVREAMQWILSRHAPWPAFALDRHWNVVMANAPAQMMLVAFDIAEGSSLLEKFTDLAWARSVIDNWEETAAVLAERLRTESAHFGGDPILDAAANTLASEYDTTSLPENPAPLSATAYRFGGQVLRFHSTIAQFGSPADIALADLKIELFFPADAATRTAFALPS